MKLDEILKIGCIFELGIKNSEGILDNYITKMEDMTDKELYFALPIEKNYYVPVRAKQKVIISSTQKDGVYAFVLPVERTVNTGRIPYFVLKYPEKKDIKRIQRRNYVRVEINVLVSLKEYSEFEKKENLACIKAVSLNLSGGGMQILSTEKIEEGQKFEIEFTLPNKEKCQQVIGEVKRVSVYDTNDNKVRFQYGIQFLEVDDKLREKIISYLFELQRERRLQGLD